MIIQTSVPNGYVFRRKKLFSTAVIALIIGGVLGGALWHLGNTYFMQHQPLMTFTSQQELVDFLKLGPSDMPQSLYDKFIDLLNGPSGNFGFRTPGGIVPFQAALEDTNGGASGVDYSGTNIQVEGVDEADIVKTDGTFLYIVSDNNIYIVRAYPPEQSEVVSIIEMEQTVTGIFINEDKLVIFETGGAVFRLYESYARSSTTQISVYDITIPEVPVLECELTVDGFYYSARMIGEYVYVIVNEPAMLFNETNVNLPVVEVNNRTEVIEASDIYYTEFPDSYDFFTTIIALNILRSDEAPTIETYLLGAMSCIYVSTQNIYLTSPVYISTISTNIHRLHIDEGRINYAANGIVPGFVLNQFSMDENENFRIATSDGTANNVYILNKQLTILGRLEGLAPNEDIYSARFMGNRCYLVTFQKVDPLFVIDLSDASSPRVLGKLKIPGYSDYLHPYDETHLIGIGKETIEAETGDFSWYQGVKISIFDVSDVEHPKEVTKFEIGDRGTDSPVLRDHKAFLFDRSRNLLVLPILLAEIDEEKYPGGVPPSTHGDFTYQGAYIFHISLSEGLIFRGRITHLTDATDLQNSGLYFSSPDYIQRSLYIGQSLYTISSNKVQCNSLIDLTEQASIELG
ncbi:MAG: beta-propeller domain-containing protein [Candidatus Bathyarchaeota archaeon]|nr:beta-propeller domain-containing protein [Candidatus Bathyarchaeota archaeon]